MPRTPRLATAVLASLCVGLAAPGCSQLESLTGADPLTALTDLPATMQQVATLTSDIADWSAQIAGFVADPQMDTLAGFVGRAADLHASLQGATSVPGVGAVDSTLEQLAQFDVAGVRTLPPQDRVAPVGGFTGIADTLGQLATQFLASR